MKKSKRETENKEEHSPHTPYKEKQEEERENNNSNAVVRSPSANISRARVRTCVCAREAGGNGALPAAALRGGVIGRRLGQRTERTGPLPRTPHWAVWGGSDTSTRLT